MHPQPRRCVDLDNGSALFTDRAADIITNHIDPGHIQGQNLGRQFGHVSISGMDLIGNIGGDAAGGRELAIGTGEDRVLQHSAAQIGAGKGALEVAKIWFGDLRKVRALVQCSTWQVAEAALRTGRGVIFLTPHLGCFEIAALYTAEHVPLTSLYRPPRSRWLEPLMLKGRNRGNARVSPANLRGVRALYKALQRGEAVGLLPDQAPQVGEGTWADFFGRPAYTMTLVRRLQKQTGAAVILLYAERLAKGEGYRTEAGRLAHMLLPDLPGDKDPFWRAGARGRVGNR